MVNKLDEDQAYLKEFTANIKKIVKIKDKYHLVLDRTYFYPEGGGQPSDTGYIDNIEVESVYKKNSEIFHTVKTKPTKEKKVDCKINWEKRFDFMQQHTGQHLLSAVLKNEVNANTVGFTLTEDSLKIDIDKKISNKILKQIEEKVNELIYKNIPIDIIYPDQNKLQKMNLRKEPTVNQNIRVISIGEIDKSPCGGTHLSNLGELGALKIIDIENYKAGLRIEFVCGKRLLKDYGDKNYIIGQLKNILSVPEEEIIEKVKRLQDELSFYDNKVNKINNELLEYKAEDLLKDAMDYNEIKIVKNIFNNQDFNNLQYIANHLTDKDSIICIFGQREKSTARILIYRSENIIGLNVNEVAKEVFKYIDGRGGGSNSKIQGGGSKVKGLKEAINRAYKLIIEKI